MDIDLFLKTVSLYGEPEPEAINYLHNTLKDQILKPNEILLRQGFLNRRLYFLNEGFIRESKDTYMGERTTGFAGQGDFFTDYESFKKHGESGISIHTEAKCVILHLDYLQYEYLINTFPGIKKIFSKLRRVYNERTNRINNSLIDDPLEIQMQTLKKEFPEVFRYSKTKHLISFFRTNYKTYQKALKKI